MVSAVTLKQSFIHYILIDQGLNPLMAFYSLFFVLCLHFTRIEGREREGVNCDCATRNLLHPV